ncbi:MAG: hypothetical protein WEE50_06130 [Chloroflexota bacterium]
MTDQAGSANGGNGEHADHDPELIAALLDRDLSKADRAVGVARTESCGECRALLADIVAVAAATVALPPLARPRDFMLGAETAARLQRDLVREPIPAGARLTGEMTHSTSRHEAHDRLLIASFVDRSVVDAERARAEQLMQDCRACAELYEELVALRNATQALPVPARLRDFTLTPADAERLRGSLWRRVLAAIGSTRDVFSRPLAIGLTTLGLAGLLVATVPMPFGGGATAERALSRIGAATEDSSDGSAAGQEFSTQASEPQPLPEASGPAVAAADPSAVPSGAGEAAPAASPQDIAPDVLFEGGESSPLAGEPDAGRNLSLAGSDASGGGFSPSPLFIVAGLLLLIGLGLFGLRWTARRLGDG